MRKFEIFRTTFFMLFLGLSACGQSQKTKSAPKSGTEQDQSWEVKIEPSKATVKNDETFLVNATIGNTGKQEQMLVFTACGYPSQWKTDNKVAHITAPNCLMNPLARLNIKVGQVYRMTVPVYVDIQSRTIRQDTVTFRMGYANSVLANGETNGSNSQPFWSNSITVTVTK
jgi:hypothetical protein